MIFAEIHEQASLWVEYRELITDPAHLLLELTLILVVDVILGAMLVPFFRSWVKRHDRTAHGHEHNKEKHLEGNPHHA